MRLLSCENKKAGSNEPTFPNRKTEFYMKGGMIAMSCDADASLLFPF